MEQLWEAIKTVEYSGVDRGTNQEDYPLSVAGTRKHCEILI